MAPFVFFGSVSKFRFPFVVCLKKSLYRHWAIIKRLPNFLKLFT